MATMYCFLEKSMNNQALIIIHTWSENKVILTNG